jgi:galactokinase/mevalonate kinase-like predicted kinase
LENTRIDEQGAKNLAVATNKCWNAILNEDIEGFGDAFRHSFEAQVAMFPNMVNPELLKELENYKRLAKGWKLSGAGGGGYFIFVVDEPIPNSMKIHIRHRNAV